MLHVLLRGRALQSAQKTVRVIAAVAGAVAASSVVVAAAAAAADIAQAFSMKSAYCCNARHL